MFFLLSEVIPVTGLNCGKLFFFPQNVSWTNRTLFTTVQVVKLWRFLGKEGFDGILEELLFIVFNVIGPQNQTPYSDSCVVQQRGLSGVDSETYTTAMFTPKVWSLVKL